MALALAVFARFYWMTHQPRPEAVHDVHLVTLDAGALK
jgi:hypothetical protein